jgi:uncharacterized protein
MQTAWGRGNWMQTYTGRQFYPMNPRPDEIDFRDIAHGLAMVCRYGGHTRRFYSVAEHTVHVSRFLEEQAIAAGAHARDVELVALEGLLHDAAEAYVGDMVRPLKQHMPFYRNAEDVVLDAIHVAVGLPGWERDRDVELGAHMPLVMPAEVKAADNRILLDERDQLLTAPPVAWEQEGLQRLGVTVECWSPVEAEEYWLQRLGELTGWKRVGGSGGALAVSEAPA